MKKVSCSRRSRHCCSAVLASCVRARPGVRSGGRRPATAPAAAAPAAAAKPYIPVISKGFQHQFWQAVKQGSEKAAKDFNVDITFEGPETEAQVDKQIEMLQTALDKKPAAICFAALDSKAAIPLLEKAKAANIPVIGFDSGVDSDIPRHHRCDRQRRCRCRGRRQNGSS